MDRTTERKRRVNVALCGFGRAGKIHFHSIRLNHRCRLKYIVDSFNLPDAYKTIQAHLEEYNLTDSGVTLVDASQYESALANDPSLDAVVIATPTETHERYVKTALRYRKAVFCEKPLAVSLDDVAYCYDLAASLGCPLYCAFQRRFDTSMSKLREQVKAGKVGKVFQIKTTSRDHPVPSIAFLKTSGGMYHDTAVHDIDMICWILGEEPEGVFAQGTVFSPEIQAIGDIDTAVITLKFPSGVLATSDLSRHASYGYDMRMEVCLLCEHRVQCTLAWVKCGFLLKVRMVVSKVSKVKC